jgi:hypothetical protein
VKEASVKHDRLLLLAGGRVEGVGYSLASIGETLLGLVEDTRALVLGAVTAGADGVADLLSGGLLALCS